MKNFLRTKFYEQINSYTKYFYVQWHITSNCTESCAHCYLRYTEGSSEFDVENAKRIIDEIHNISSKRNLIPYIAYTGGDALLHKDIVELIEYATKKQIIVHIKGNPNLLNAKTVSSMAESGVKQYQLSIDGNESTHDKIRSPGSFRKTIDALELFKNTSIKTLVKFTVSRINYMQIESVLDMMERSKVNYFDFARLCPISEDDFKNILTTEEYREFLVNVLTHYQRMKSNGCHINLLFRDHLWMPLFYELGIIKPEDIPEKGEIICGCSMANNNAIVINYNGDVLPCAKTPKYICGCVFDNSLEAILEGIKFKSLSVLDNYNGCQNCKLISFCRGCPAISSAVKGNIFDKDPTCWFTV